MPTQIVIQHLSGSKSNQIEQFPIDNLTELTLGRDPKCAIVFDPQRDDVVSRRHASIAVRQGDAATFWIKDLGSSNGTRVNSERIAAEIELLPGDVVELGTGGPKFSFDVQPRPPHLVAHTRVLSTAGTTRVLNVADVTASAVIAAAQASPSAKRGPSHETVERMVSASRSEVNRNWMYVLAAVLVVVGAGSAWLYHQNRTRAEQTAAQAAAALAQEKSETAEKLASAAAAVKRDIGMSPEEIVRKYGNATVVIDIQWRAYDKATGKPLYQMVKTVNGQRFPCYVKLANGNIVRWLTTDDEDHTNLEIGASGRGSGFVISSDGYILTNKHVAAGWLARYGEREQNDRGAIYDIKRPTAHPQIIELAADRANFSELFNWIPDTGGVVFRSNQPVPVDDTLHQIEGRSDSMEVRFPGNLLSISAHLVRASSIADVAEIKVDTQQKLAAVDLADNDDVAVGEKVTVLGYPAFSAQTIAVIRSAEAGQLRQKEETVPEPTVTAGLVSQKSAGAEQQSTGIVTVGEMGEAYQLTVPSGAGNSGGPVFNEQGKVIGLFTYGTSRETVTYAVPIKFGRDLLQVQRNN